MSHNAANSPTTVGLTGSGTAPVTLSATSLSLGNQAVGMPSPPKSVTLTNQLSGPLAVTAIQAVGDFSQSNNCGFSIAAGASCVVSVVFTPTVAGTRTGTLTILDSAATSPQTVALSGNGTLQGLISLMVTPATSSLLQGANQQFRATGTYNNGVTADLTNSVTWSRPPLRSPPSPRADWPAV